MNIPPEPSVRPSLETLLRLKRSERPDADFWNEFDRGMKQKQLAAIVEPKPWWLEGSLLVRKFVPLAGAGLAGAAALFAVVALRTEMASGPSPRSLAAAPDQSVRLSPTGTALASVPAAAPARSLVASTPEVVAVSPRSSSSLVLASAAPGRVTGDETKRADAVSSLRPGSGDPLDGITLRVAELTAVPGTDARFVGLTTAAVVPASANLPVSAGAEGPGQFVTSLPQVDASSMTVAEAETSPAVADKDVVPFTNPRQARLLAMVADEETAADSLSLAHVRDRVIHRMSEGESLYASISRLGVSGDRLSVRF